MSLLITLEGLDGTGKSTLAQSLVEEMSQQRSSFYPWIYSSKEPGSPWTGLGPQLRQLVLETPDLRPIERELMFYVDASMHARFIDNQQNAIIVSDRGKWSHFAYLKGYLKTKQIDWDEYSLCKKFIDLLCAEPDCVVYLKGSLALMKDRLASKQKDAIESNGSEFFSAVLDTYGELVSDRQRTGKPTLVLEATDSTCHNRLKVLSYLKEVFNEQQLIEGRN